MRQIERAAQIMREGGVIAYPTEAVFGLGCDPFNDRAVEKILRLKNRAAEKGLILIAANWQQLQPLVQHIPLENLRVVLDSWPGPFTWTFPASALIPDWVRGKHSTLAVRVTNHPIANMLCQAFGKPIISTSANTEGQAPARDETEVKKYFDEKLDLIVNGAVGGLKNPTEIRDALTGKILRAN